MDTDPWDFYYVDEQLLRMYYTLLPEADQATFRSRAFSNQPTFEVGLAPKFQTTRYRPELPYDKSIALALFMDEQIRRHYEVTSLKRIASKFIIGKFDALYGVVAVPRLLPFLIAYPQEGIEASLERDRSSFLVLGESTFCWRASQFEPQHSAADSVFSRILDLFANVRLERIVDVTAVGEDVPYELRPGGMSDYLDKLMSILAEYRPTLQLDTFSGMFARRQVLQTKLGSLSVIYPLYLRRRGTAA